MKDYETKYLLSAHWTAFRKLALEAQSKRLGRNVCQRCHKGVNEGPPNELHVHHLTYERLGSELIEDVEIVCRECHDKIHLRDPQSRARHYAPGYRDL
ncbi:MAG: HNH endonuclease [Xanthobacteraceae bacterium]